MNENFGYMYTKLELEKHWSFSSVCGEVLNNDVTIVDGVLTIFDMLR